MHLWCAKLVLEFGIRFLGKKMSEKPRKSRLESSVVVPVRSSPKRYRVHSEADSDGEHRARKWTERRRTSPLKWERNYENRNRGNRRGARHERVELERDRDQLRGVSQRIPDQSISERLEQRRSTGKDFGVRHSSVMDLDPSDVPREGKYFLHDNRESGARAFNQRSSWGRGGRRGIGKRRNERSGEPRRSRSPIWKHDKFEEIEAEDGGSKETLTNEKEQEVKEDKK